MDRDEAQRRYGDAIAQTLNKYATAVKAPVKPATVDDGIGILNTWAEPVSRKPKKLEEDDHAVS